jgi:ribosomal protein S27E
MVLFARSARDSLERKMPHFVSNKYRLVAESSYWCFPRNQQRAVTPTRPWATFLADLGGGDGELPAFVLDEFESYLRCGIPVHGFLRVRCRDCGHSGVVAFACKRRVFCPSCLGRRMADTAAFCVDYLFPRVPTRQYVLSLPYALRFKMAYSPDATSVVLDAFISAINSDLRRRARKRKLRGRLQTGSVTVVQRFGSSLNLNVHFHAIVMDGLC